MAHYVVLEPPGTNRTERARFECDGFALSALFVPLIWLVFHRLWFEAAAFFAVSVLIGVSASYFQIGFVVPVLIALLSLLVALEGGNWKISQLRRNGFVETAAICADDLDEAELRYFYQPATRQATPTATGRPAEEWMQLSPVPAGNSHFGSTIGFVGHRGEH